MSDVKGRRCFFNMEVVVRYWHKLHDMKAHAYLHGWWCDLHTQDDVSHFALSQGTNIDVVLLAIICKDKILQGHFDANPLLV